MSSPLHWSIYGLLKHQNTDSTVSLLNKEHGLSPFSETKQDPH